MGPIYRQGDVLIMRVASAPKAGKPIARDTGRIVLAYGEVTGHSHAIKSRFAKMFALLDRPIEDTLEADRLLNVTRTVALEHEEHSTIKLPPGNYIIRRQREYAPGAIVNVQD